MKRITLVVSLLLALLYPLVFSDQKKEDIKHIVFIAGNRSHGPGEHEFYAGCMLLAKALNEQSGLKVKATVLRADWPKEHKSVVASADTVVIYADHVSAHGGQWEFLDGLASKGVGMVFMHYAVHPSKEIGEKYYRPWIGAAMESGFSVNPHWVADLSVIKDHEIGNGVPDQLTALDEWYYHMRFIKERDKVLDLFTAVPTRQNMNRYINMWNKNGVEGLGKPQTLMWGYERPAGGRGIGFVGGHYHEGWAIDGIRKAILNAIVWTAGMKVPAEGVLSKTPTEEELNVNLDKKGRVKRIKIPDPAAWKKLPPAKIQTDREAGFNKGAGAKVRPAPAPQKKNSPGVASPEPALTGKEIHPEATPAPKAIPATGILLPSDLEITTWAEGPILARPLSMDTDHAGRIWVAERHATDTHPNGSRIVILEDKDHDGKADKSHVFIEDSALEGPLEISVFGNRVVAFNPPHLTVYTDTNENLVFEPEIDKCENLLSGFKRGRDTDSVPAIFGGPDGRWYFGHDQAGAEFKDKGGVNFIVRSPALRDEPNKPENVRDLTSQTSGDGKVWVGGFAASVNPDGSGLRIVGHGFNRSVGQTMTSFGDMFQNDQSDTRSCRVTWLMEGSFLGFCSPDGRRTWQIDQRPGQPDSDAEWRQWDPGTLSAGDTYDRGSPRGMCFYENGSLPRRYAGLLASCDAERGEVFGYFPVMEKSGFQLERFSLVKSKTPDGFHPIDILVGSDGALYLATADTLKNPPSAQEVSPNAGTIYRIAPKDFRPTPKPLPADPIKRALALLSSPAQNVRFSGVETLRTAREKALPALRGMLGHYDGYLQARALWVLPHLGAEGKRITRSLLESSDASTRLLAFRSLRGAGEDFLGAGAQLVPGGLLRKFYSEEPSPAVRREVVLSLRDANPQQKATSVSYFLRRCSASDPAYLEACGLASEGAEELIWSRLKTLAGISLALEWPEAFTKITWRLRPSTAILDLRKRALSESLSDDARIMAVETLALSRDIEVVRTLIEIAKAKGPVGKEARRWLFHLAGTRWVDLDLVPLLKAHGIIEQEN